MWCLFLTNHGTKQIFCVNKKSSPARLKSFPTCHLCAPISLQKKSMAIFRVFILLGFSRPISKSHIMRLPEKKKQNGRNLKRCLYRNTVIAHSHTTEGYSRLNLLLSLLTTLFPSHITLPHDSVPTCWLSPPGSYSPPHRNIKVTLIFTVNIHSQDTRRPNATAGIHSPSRCNRTSRYTTTPLLYLLHPYARCTIAAAWLSARMAQEELVHDLLFTR